MHLLKGFVDYVQGREEEFVPQLRHISTVKPSKPIEPCFLIRNSSNKIGRCAKSELVLDSDLVPNMISRTHAIIEREMTTVPVEQVNRLARERPPDSWSIQDKSMNGVFVNNVRIDKSRLVHGDIVIFGGGGERSVTRLGGKVEQPVSEFIFRFETLREPGVNDKFQHRKPSLKQSAPEVLLPTQVQLVGDEGATLDFQGPPGANSDGVLTCFLEESKAITSGTDAIETQMFEDKEVNGDTTDTQEFPGRDAEVPPPCLDSRSKTVPSRIPADPPPEIEEILPVVPETDTGQRRVRKRQSSAETKPHKEALFRTTSGVATSDNVGAHAKGRKRRNGPKTDAA